jgi:hypothetical protein
MNPHNDSPFVIYDAFACPHCANLRGSCCQCGGTKVIRDPEAVIAAVAFVWARRGCICDACRLIGTQPGRAAA